MTRAGAISGIVVGSLTVIIWSQLEGGIFDLYELVPAFLFSFISICAVSIFNKSNKD